MPNLKLIIFDFDGVLRPISWERLYNAYNLCIRAVGKNPDDFYIGVDGFREWFDSDWHKNEERIFGCPYVRQPKFDALFHQYYDASTELFPWVPGVIEALSSKKFLLAVFSSANAYSVEGELGFWATHFCEIVGADKVKKLKPDPEGILYLLGKYQIKPEHAIMIGDMPIDILAGRSAGTMTGAVLWGLGKEKELRDLAPDIVFKLPLGLIELC